MLLDKTQELQAFFDEVSTRLREVGAGALVLIDIKDFFQVNHALGRSQANALLLNIQQNMNSSLSEVDGIARFRGNTFVFFLPGRKSTECCAVVYERVSEALKKSLVGKDKCPHVDFRMAVSNYPDAGKTVDELMNGAEHAIRQCKESNESFGLSIPIHIRELFSQPNFLSNFDQYVRSGAIQFYLQPKVEMRHGLLIGAECLFRWKLGEDRYYKVSDVIAAAEASGAMDKLAKWGILEALEMQSSIKAAGIDVPLSINLSVTQLSSVGVLNAIKSLADRYPHRVSEIEFEITEESIKDTVKVAMEHAKVINDLGFGMSVDDFGKGHSNFMRIVDIKPSVIKIDKSFIHSLADSAEMQAVIKAIVDIGYKMDALIIAEGIESEEQAEVLLELGVDVGQGWHFGRPMPLIDFIDRFRPSRYVVNE